MEAGSSKLLENITQKTLHAHNFARTSSQASHVLTDLVSRYFLLLADTCAQYAHHAGRSALVFEDAIKALDELGVSMQDLSEFYEVEGRDMRRYVSLTARRAEELAVLRAFLQDGLKQDRDDALHLVYTRIPTPPPNNDVEMIDEDDLTPLTSEPESDSDIENKKLPEAPRILTSPAPVLPTPVTPDARATSPPLPLSPVSNPSSPRKRPRTSTWKAPDHIPDFLPPYPSSTPPLSPIGSPRATPADGDLIGAASPPKSNAANANNGAGSSSTNGVTDKQMVPMSQFSNSASTSDYLTPVPYSMSSISSQPDWHLPRSSSPPRDSGSHSNTRTSIAGGLSISTSNLSLASGVPTPSTSSSTIHNNTSLSLSTSLPEVNQSLLHAYHHVLTTKPSLSHFHSSNNLTNNGVLNPNSAQINPERHKLAMAFLREAYRRPRWTTGDTLFSSSVGPEPRMLAPAPSFPVAIAEVSGSGTGSNGAAGGGKGSGDAKESTKSGKGGDKDKDKDKDKEKGLGAGSANGVGGTPSLPAPVQKTVAMPEPITPLSSLPTSRIPEIARQILPPKVYARTTRLPPPVPLVRDNVKLKYGTPILAPWNTGSSGSSTSGTAANATNDAKGAKGKAGGKGVKGGAGGGSGEADGNQSKDKDSKTSTGVSTAPLADALLYATWDWDVKDFRVPLVVPHSHHHGTGGTSHGPGHPTRRASVRILPVGSSSASGGGGHGHSRGGRDVG